MKYNFLLFYPYAYGPYVHMCKIHLVGNIDIKVSKYICLWFGACEIMIWGLGACCHVPSTSNYTQL